VPGGSGGPGAGPDVAAPTVGQARRVAGKVAAALGTRDVLTLYSAAGAGSAAAGKGGQYLGGRAATLNQAGTQVNNYSGPLYVATPALLRHFGIGQAQVRSAADVLTMRAGLSAEPRMQLAVPPPPPVTARDRRRTAARRKAASPTR
jgi:hypothetical protein